MGNHHCPCMMQRDWVKACIKIVSCMGSSGMPLDLFLFCVSSLCLRKVQLSKCVAFLNNGFCCSRIHAKSKCVALTWAQWTRSEFCSLLWTGVGVGSKKGNYRGRVGWGGASDSTSLSEFLNIPGWDGRVLPTRQKFILL